MQTISLCMIVKNEEDVLAKCLDSIKGIVDEIIIVDTGSTDRTKEIAALYTEKIYDFEWINHFGKARNFSFSKATMDYVFWLDADDVLLEEDQKKLISLKEEMDGSVDSYSMIYHLGFDQEGNSTYNFPRYRLVKRTNGYQWVGAVHEYLEYGGKIVHTDIGVVHQKPVTRYEEKQSNRNLKIYEDLVESGEELTSRDLFYYANELKDHGRLEEAIETYQKFLNRPDGWVEDKIRACINMSDSLKVLNHTELAKEVLLATFTFDAPRAEVCCKMADLYFNELDYNKAIGWYKIALSTDETTNQGFRLMQYSTWYPHLQLSVCYWKKDRKEDGKYHHEKAKESNKSHPVIMANDKYFNE